MAYRLSIGDDVPAAVRVCAREQLERAVERLAHADADPVDAIHEVRKHLKKTRALLRLVRPALGKRAYRRENAALRGAGLALSGTRDADVLAETAARLGERYAGRLPAPVFEQLCAALAGAGTPAHGGLADHGDVLEGLRAAVARVERWSLGEADWGVVLRGAARAYARGGRAFAIARVEPTDEHLHTWRKRVKDLWYHERLLAAVWPDVLGAHGEQAHVLSELLGDDHDLAVLRERLEHGLEPGPAAAAELAPLLGLVEERRAELRAQAWQLGRRLYAESPTSFARRLTRYVQAAVEEQRVPTSAA